MEYIEMRYVFNDGDDDVKEVREIRRSSDKNPLYSSDVCEMFLDLMESAGFSPTNIFDYFRE